MNKLVFASIATSLQVSAFGMHGNLPDPAETAETDILPDAFGAETSFRSTSSSSSIPIFGSIRSNWGNPFSEEQGLSEYMSGAPLAGIKVSGTHNDNKALKFYSNPPTNKLKSKESPWITDKPSGNQVWDSDCSYFLPNGYITRLQCDGRYCDNIKFTCETSQGVTVDTAMQSQSSFISDESNWGNDYTCQQGYALTGIRCAGDYCDNLKLQCSKLIITAKISIQKIQATYSYKGVGTFTLRSQKTLSKAMTDAVSSGSETSWGISNTADVGFSGAVFSGSNSFTAEMSQSISNSVSSEIKKSESQSASEMTQISSTKDCGSSNAVVWQFGYTTVDSNSGSSTLRTPTFVCSTSSIGIPKCLPQDCGNTKAITVDGIAPGCQCCRAGTPSLTATGAQPC